MNVTSLRGFTAEVRALLLPWGLSLLFPMPLILVGAENASPDLATLYIALGAAWLAGEVFRSEKQGTCSRARIAALFSYLVFNVIAFSFFGWAAGIHSNIPFPLLCLLAMFPAAGLVPWLMLRIGHPHGALVLGAIIVGGVKIFGCVVARIVYGPDYIALGYVSADWSTAKLMISFMWSGTVVVSIISGRSAFKELMQRRSS